MAVLCRVQFLSLPSGPRANSWAAGVGLALLAVGTLGLVLELWRRAVRTPLDGPAALALAGGTP